MPRLEIASNVFEAAIERLETLYADGQELVVSFSAGKDSGVCLELCIIAARKTGRLPVKVIMRDEEVMFPGTFEYAERVANRKEVDMHWIYANQPIVNYFNRGEPYFWVFDPQLPPSAWVRQPPAFAYRIPQQNITAMTIPERFPPAAGKELYAVMGLRGQESRLRLMSIHSAKGYITKPNEHGVRNCRPIYDWSDGDVWRAVRDNGWDYNDAYNVMLRLGMPRARLRIAPPTMTASSVETLRFAARAWPIWFDAVCHRLPGVRTAAQFGRRAVMPIRKLGESWEACFHRTCVDDAPDWIRQRALHAKRSRLSAHGKHSSTPFPEVVKCHHCDDLIQCWRDLANALYMGDPFSQKLHHLPYVEPEFFRAGAGVWGGNPTF